MINKKSKTESIEYKATCVLHQESENIEHQIYMDSFTVNPERRKYDRKSRIGNWQFFKKQQENKTQELIQHKKKSDFVANNQLLFKNRIYRCDHILTESYNNNSKTLDINQTIENLESQHDSKPKLSISLLIPKLSEFKYDIKIKRIGLATSNYFQNYFKTKIKTKNSRVISIQKDIKEIKRFQKAMNIQAKHCEMKEIEGKDMRMPQVCMFTTSYTTNKKRQKLISSRAGDRSLNFSVNVKPNQKKEPSLDIKKRNKIQIKINQKKLYSDIKKDDQHESSKILNDKLNQSKELNIIRRLIYLQKI